MECPAPPNSIPPDDAFVVTKLRAAGAIILGKANMSEFASPPNRSSLGGQSLNPHDLERSPAGSTSHSADCHFFFSGSSEEGS